MTEGFATGNDLFGGTRIFKEKGKVESERSSAVRWFVEKTGRDPKYIAIRTAHFSLEQLYYLQSAWRDRENRDGVDTARKHFYYMIKTMKA